MNILHLITSLKIGGAESSLVNYLSAVAEKPHACQVGDELGYGGISSKFVGKDGNTHSVVYFHPGPNVDKIQNMGIKTYQISGILSIYDPVFFFRLAKLIKFINPDLIHSSLWSANITARLISKFYKIPVICDLHGNSFDEGRLRNWFDRRTVNYCAKIVAVSDSVKDAYFKNIIGSKNITGASSKLAVIKNGIDVQALRYKAFKEPLTRKDFGFADNDFVIGAVGRLEPIKSYDVLIKAFALFLSRIQETKFSSMSQAKLVIIGDGSQRESLVNLAKSLKIEPSVIFTGYRSDAYRFYQILDCFALSSQSEGLSIALLEAMAFGLPVISTNLDINRHDVITPEINGFLVYPNDIEGYALAINKLFQDHQEGQSLRNVIRQRNLELVSTEFCIDGVVDKYQKLYQTVVGGSSCGKK